MLKTLSTFGAAIVISIAFIGDPTQTSKCLITIVTVRGAAFLVRKLIKSLNTDMADIIDFTAWCICVPVGVSIIKCAILGIAPVTEFFVNFGAGMQEIANSFGKIAEWLDKVTFWN